jgi:hypothetical protein
VSSTSASNLSYHGQEHTSTSSAEDKLESDGRAAWVWSCSRKFVTTVTTASTCTRSWGYKYHLLETTKDKPRLSHLYYQLLDYGMWRMAHLYGIHRLYRDSNAKIQYHIPNLNFHSRGSEIASLCAVILLWWHTCGFARSPKIHDFPGYLWSHLCSPLCCRLSLAIHSLDLRHDFSTAKYCGFVLSM